MSKNTNLHKAKKEKNDEFYTQLSDIEKELRHYKDRFAGKTVYCNCDDARESNFFKYFSINFEHLGLKKLICTGYKKDGRGVLLVYEGDKNGNRVVDDEEITVTELEGDGDFRSEECVKLLEEADIVVTNPPFSIIDEFLDQLVQYNKKFLFITPLTIIMREDAFNLMKTEKIWPGINWVKEFKRNTGELDKMGNIVWFTNLDHKSRHEKLIPVEEYSPEKYPAYANYSQAIEVGKIANIPKNYAGEMGVSISYIMHHCPDQFEIVGGSRWLATKMSDMGWPKDSYVPGGVAFYLDESTANKQKYRRLFGRIVIRAKAPAGEPGAEDPV